MSGFESGELSNTSNLVPVLARLLEFTPADKRKVAEARPKSWMDGLPAMPVMPAMSNAGSVIGSSTSSGGGGGSGGGSGIASGSSTITPGIFSSKAGK